MGVTAAIAAVSMIGSTVAQVESGNQQRRLAGQAKNRQDGQIKAAENEKREATRQEENRAFSKIQRQRQRAMMTGSTAESAAGAAGGALGGSILGTGNMSSGKLAGIGGMLGSVGNKTTLGS